MIPFQDVQQEHAQRAFQLVELLAAQGFDLLGKVVAVELVPAAFAHEPRLLHQPGIEVAIVRRTGFRRSQGDIAVCTAACHGHLALLKAYATTADGEEPGAHARCTKLSTTRFSPALSNWMTSLLPSIVTTSP